MTHISKLRKLRERERGGGRGRLCFTVSVKREDQ